MDMKKLIEECKTRQAASQLIFKNESYDYLGEYYLDNITLEQMNNLNKMAWDRHSERCVSALYELAADSNDPLVHWIAHNVPNKKTAFHLIKRLPMDLEQIDMFAKRNKWCAAYFNQHRPKAIADKVVTEYK